MDSIVENKTWIPVDLPSGYKHIALKGIFKGKGRVDGTIERFKARLVIRNFNQRHGIDYFDTDVLIARIATIRVLIPLTAIQKLVIHQIYVKTTFLNGELEEEAYMEQNEDFVIPVQEKKVFKLTIS